MAKVKFASVSLYNPKPKGKGRHSKKASKNKTSKKYVKRYRGQGR